MRKSICLMALVRMKVVDRLENLVATWTPELLVEYAAAVGNFATLLGVAVLRKLIWTTKSDVAQVTNGC